ncbi:MAG: hypothetical protein ACR2MG_00140 [Pyrinomonadaceae bacterium]
MAHFTNAQGIRISGQNLEVQIGESKEIGLWGFRDFNGQPLTVDVMTGNGQQCSEIASVYQIREQGDTRFYRVRGVRAGNGRIDAITGSLNSWDNMNLTVSGSSSPLSNLVKALDDKSLTINRGDANVIRSVADGSTTISIDPQIVNLLNNLLMFGNLDIMSLLRRGQSQHGVVSGNHVTCKAVDIQGYRGIPVRLRPKDVAINVVCLILARFPEGQFDLGFPRPVGGATGFHPPDDVFFSVPDVATAQQCWDGTISRSLNQMLQPAQDRVRLAMPANTRFRILYPDGLNHLHVSVTRNPI